MAQKVTKKDRRVARIVSQVSDTDKKRIEVFADAMHMSISDVVRHQVMSAVEAHEKNSC